MDKSTCAYVASILKNINQDKLNQEFSKFGRITKIFIEPDRSSAKVYLDTVEGVKRACPRLNGIFGWEVSLFKSELRRPPKSSCNSNTTNIQQAMEFVDVHGKPLEIVEDEEGRIFVSLKDIKASGFYVFEKNLYSQCELPKSMDLQQFELFLLNQGKNYILNHKKNFNEGEILNVLHRVEMALIHKSEPVQNGLAQNLPANTHSNDYQNHSTAPQGSAGNRRPPNRNFSNDNHRPKQERQNHQNSNRNHNENYSQNKRKPFGNQPFSNQRPKQFVNNTAANQENWEENVEVKPAEPESIQVDNRSNASSSNRSLINVDRVQLAPGTSYKVKVTYFNSQKPNLFYGQFHDNEKIVMELLCRLNSENANQTELTETARNTLCSVQFEEIWYRGVVLQQKLSGNFLVELLDYGNRIEVSGADLKQLPEDMKQIPAQAIRFTIHQNVHETLNIDDILEVFVRKHFEDMTHLINVVKVLQEEDIEVKSEEPVEKQEDCFTEIPASNLELQIGESVIIVNVVDNKLILRNKATAAISKQVYAHLASMQKAPINNPKVGQLVLCSKDSIEGLHRAIITKITEKTAEVKFIDYRDSDTLALQSLRNMDKTLASLPISVLELDCPSLEKTTPDGEAILNMLILQKKKLKTELINGKLELMVTTENGEQTPLSEAISAEKKPTEIATPKASAETKPVETNQSVRASTSKACATTPANEPEPGLITFDDMGFVQLETGLNNYVAYSCTGETATLIPMREEVMEYLATLDNINPAENQPYKADLMEMCVAKFKDIWYRGMVTDIKNDGVREILFVDYGNSEDVNVADIRHFSKDLKDIPILSVTAQFEGIPDKTNMHERIKELIPDQTLLEVNVIKANAEDMEFLIQVPSVYDELKKEGLM